VPAEGSEIVYPFTEAAGVYRLKGKLGASIVSGFSVNLPTEASDLTRLNASQLDEILGHDGYRLARSESEIDRGIGEARVGREFYPILLVLLAIVLGLEHVLANLFYRGEKAVQVPVLKFFSRPPPEARRAESA
jgi:hypothetical protein